MQKRARSTNGAAIQNDNPFCKPKLYCMACTIMHHCFQNYFQPLKRTVSLPPEMLLLDPNHLYIDTFRILHHYSKLRGASPLSRIHLQVFWELPSLPLPGWKLTLKLRSIQPPQRRDSRQSEGKGFEGRGPHSETCPKTSSSKHTTLRH